MRVAGGVLPPATDVADLDGGVGWGEGGGRELACIPEMFIASTAFSYKEELSAFPFFSLYVFPRDWRGGRQSVCGREFRLLVMFFVLFP